MSRPGLLQHTECRCPALAFVALLAASTLVAPASAQTIDEARALLRAQKLEEAAPAFAAIAEREPENGLAWYLLGYTNHTLGRYEAAITAYEKAEALSFNPPGTPYNIACSYALLGDTDQAIAYLEKAAAAGFSSLANLDGDTDLASVRDDGRYAAIRAQIEKASKPCDGEAFRRFDFWVGEWNVTNNGQFVGTNTIERISNGCALLESWVDGNGVPGHSINFYDPHADRWKQTWVGGGGLILEFVEVDEADYGGASMRFVATTHDAQGTASLQRMSFWVNDDSSVRQLFESSSDEGATWTTSFDGRYVRKDQAQAQP